MTGCEIDSEDTNSNPNAEIISIDEAEVQPPYVRTKKAIDRH